MGNKPIKAVLVGYGGMAHWHEETLAKIDEVSLYGVYDILEEKVEEAKGKGLKGYSSLEEVLNDPEVELITIATPNDVHREIAIRAMDAGKNVVSEKPVTLSSEDLAAMIDASKRNGVVFTVHQNRRWDEDYRTAKKIYDEKLLGEVYRIESRVHGSRGIPGDWRGRKEKGGGMMLDWGVHIIDQMLLLIPEKIKKVYAKMYHVTNEEVDDGFTLNLTFESGKTAMLEVGTSNFVNLPRWYILGVNGTAVIDDFAVNGKIVSVTDWDKKDAVPIRTAAGLTKTMAPRTDETIKESPLPVQTADIREFYQNVAAAIRGEAETFIRHEELMRVMKLMEAAFLSDQKGEAVDFE